MHDQAYDIRTVVGRGIVTGIDDTGIAQTVDVQLGDGVAHHAVEVWQPFGLTTAPPAEGSTVVLLANGGDRGDLVALPAACPSARFGGLQPGETVLYGVDGTRIALRLGGVVNVLAAAQVNVSAPQVTITTTGAVTFNAPGGATVNGPATITGNAHVEGNLQVDGNINANGHISGH